MTRHLLPLDDDDRAELHDLLVRVYQRERALAQAASGALNSGHLTPAMVRRQRDLLDDASATAVTARRYADALAHGGLISPSTQDGPPLTAARHILGGAPDPVDAHAAQAAAIIHDAWVPLPELVMPAPIGDPALSTEETP